MKKFMVCFVLSLLSLSQFTFASQYTITGTNVNYPTQEQIAKFFTDYAIEDAVNTVDSFAEVPSFTEPYASGALSAETQNSVLDTLNYIRYIAGIGYEVETEETYIEKAQDATFVLGMNNLLTHSPQVPTALEGNANFAATVENGIVGAGASNISMYTPSLRPSLASCLISGWMYDGDSLNIERVGHRRWVLNPSMGATGFGSAIRTDVNRTYSAMFALDGTDSKADFTGVAWPAQNTPVDLFTSNYPWSFSVGQVVGTDVSVTLTRLNDGTIWQFDSSDKDSSGKYFNVDNSGSGQKGCVIFRPDPSEISYDAGDIFQVTIVGDVEANYFVSFFDVYATASATSLTPVSTPSTPLWLDSEQEVVQSVSVNPVALSLNIGETASVTASVLPSSAAERLSWVSNDKTVATVSANGQVTGVGVGATTIVAVVDGKTAHCSVTVKSDSADSTDYTVELTVPVHGTLSVSHAQPDVGALVEISATASTGYEISSVTVTGKTGSQIEVEWDESKEKYVFTMPSESVVVSAVFQIQGSSGSHSLTHSNFGNGNTYFSNTSPEAGELVKMNINSDYGFVVERVEAKDIYGKNIEVVNTGLGMYQFEQPATAVHVEVFHRDVSLIVGQYSDIGYYDWYTGSVAYCIDNGLMHGTESWTFNPHTGTTRAMVAVVFANMSGEIISTATEQRFSDVPLGEWYSDAISWCQERGIVSGYADGSFGVYTYVSHQELLTMLYGFARYQSKDLTVYATDRFQSYSDSWEVESYAETPISWALGMGLYSGEEGNLLPFEKAERARFTQILYEYCKGAINWNR